MGSYIKTIINGIKVWVANRLNCLEENLGKKIDAAKRTADTAKSTAESKADSQNPVFSGSFSQNRNPLSTVGGYSHAEGNSTEASGDYSHAEGRYNIEDTTGKYAHIVGNGISQKSRSNAHTLDWSGVGWFAGGLKVGGTGQDDEAAVDVALKTDIPNTAPVVFADESGVLINADEGEASAEEVYNALLTGPVYVKLNSAYYIVQNFTYQDGVGITIVIWDGLNDVGAIKYEVSL